ncbi:hypothetical protein HDU87_008029 [Geranomyces variabilis]|uniref:Transforming acidic coiled-coil-containing protein C-terminal domain-containing protein n=1 Tax=Geranomyces variabilis TaxID=109894 RepID=A0AAD5XTG7_9FUNG|nr:hypothetical protein HDU87_008029 [Geranomyces variabilis]
MNISANNEARERLQQVELQHELKPLLAPSALSFVPTAVESGNPLDRPEDASPPRPAPARARPSFPAARDAADIAMQPVHDAEYWLQKGASPLQPHSATPSPRKARIFSRDVHSPSPVEVHRDTVMSIRELDVVEEEDTEVLDKRLEMDDLRVDDKVEQSSHQLSPSPLKKKPRHSPTRDAIAIRRASISASSAPPSSFEATSRRLLEMHQHGLLPGSFAPAAHVAPKTPLPTDRIKPQKDSPSEASTTQALAKDFVEEFRQDLEELRSPIKRVVARVSPTKADAASHASGDNKVAVEASNWQPIIMERKSASPQKAEVANVSKVAETKKSSPRKSPDRLEELPRSQDAAPALQPEKVDPESEVINTTSMSEEVHDPLRPLGGSPHKLVNALEEKLLTAHSDSVTPTLFQSPIATAAEKGQQIPAPLVHPSPIQTPARHSAPSPAPAPTVHVTPVKKTPPQQPADAGAQITSSIVVGTPAVVKAATTPRQPLHPEVYSHEVGQTSSLVDRDAAVLKLANTSAATSSAHKQQAYLMTPIRQPPGAGQAYQQSTAFDAKFMAEFDPLIPATTVVPNDWFMRFETPEAAQAAMAVFSPGPNQSPVAMRAAASAAFAQFAGQPASLLDTAIELPSPRSIIKYTDKDVEQMKAAWAAESQNQLNDLKKKLQADFEESKKQMEADFALIEADFENRLQAQRIEAQEALKQRIAGWERYTNQMMEERAQESDRAAREQERILAELQESLAEKNRMAKEIDVLEIKHMQQRIDTKEMRSASERLTQHLEEANKKLEKADEDYHKLMANAQDTIAQANAEIARAAREHEKEISIATARAQKFEAKFNSATKALLSKDEEIKQLSEICDGLVQDMERGARR